MLVAVLFLSLGDPDWGTRDAAEQALVRLVDGWPWDYGPGLERLAKDVASPEIAFRIRRPLRTYYAWQASSYVPTGVPVWPVCDCYPVAIGLGVDIRDRSAVLPAGATDVTEPRIEKVADGWNGGGPRWCRWRKGTEDMARRLIREGTTAAEVDALLQRMWRLELEAGSDCNARGVLESWQGRPWAGGYPQPE